VKAAIFDLDGTLISLSGERRFIPWLVLTLRLCPFKMVPYIYRSLKDRDFFSTKLYYRGKRVEELDALAAKFFAPNRVKKLVFKGALEEIEKRRREGAKLILLTGSPLFIARQFSVLGFDRIIGSLIEEKDGVYTGELLDYPSGPRKREIIQRLADEDGIDLQESYGYGNSSADAHFLSLLGNPVAVNPSRRLRKIAREKGWKVVRWR